MKERIEYRNNSLWIYRNGYLYLHVSVDSTFYGLDWCIRHGMKPEEKVTADNGKNYDIWRSKEYVAAIPA